MLSTDLGEVTAHLPATIAHAMVVVEAQVPFRVIEINHAFTALTGYEPSDIEGRSLALLRGAATEPAAAARLDATITARQPGSITLTHHDRSGRTYADEVLVLPLPSVEDRGATCLCLLRDVSPSTGGAAAANLRLICHGSHDIEVCRAADGVGELLAYASAGVVGATTLMEDLVPAERDRLGRALAYGRPIALDLRLEAPPDRRRYLLLEAWPATGHGPGVFDARLSDATRAVAVRERLVLLEAAVVHANDVVLMTDAAPCGADGPRIVYANAAFERHTGWRAQEVIGRTPHLLQGPDTDPAARRFMAERLRDWRAFEVEVLNYRRDGSTYWNEISVVPVPDAEGRFRHWVSIQRDVTEHRRAVELAAEAALHDSLTGLPNRVLCTDRLERALRTARRMQRHVGVVTFDLDLFKSVNDRAGHAAGDAVLRSIADRVGSRLRASDTLARLGGDEFMVVLADVAKPNDVMIVAEELARVLAEPIVFEGRTLPAGATVGTAVFPRDGEDAETLVRHADLALSEAKRRRRGLVLPFTPDLRHAAEDGSRLEADLQRALDADEFSLSFQPQIGLADGAVAGFECLVRWTHPDRGLLLPSTFLRAVAEARLMEDLGRRVTDHALATAARWTDDGLGFANVSINVDMLQLASPGFAGDVLERLETWGVAPECLAIEVIERMLAGPHSATARANIETLAEAGVGIDLDDFGSGHAALAHLRRLPVRRLKIARSFIADMLDDRAVAAIVRAVLGLAAELEIDVVAEGIETERQAAVLRAQGCRFGQGFHFAAPMSAEEAVAWLAARPKRSD